MVLGCEKLKDAASLLVFLDELDKRPARHGSAAFEMVDGAKKGSA